MTGTAHLPPHRSAIRSRPARAALTAIGVLCLLTVGCATSEGDETQAALESESTTSSPTTAPTTTPSTTAPSTTAPSTTASTSAPRSSTTHRVSARPTPSDYVRHESATGRVSLALPDDWSLFEIPDSLGEHASFFAVSGDSRATINIVEEPGEVRGADLPVLVERRLASNRYEVEPVGVDGEEAVAAVIIDEQGVWSAMFLVFPVDGATAWVALAGKTGNEVPGNIMGSVSGAGG